MSLYFQPLAKSVLFTFLDTDEPTLDGCLASFLAHFVCGGRRRHGCTVLPAATNTADHMLHRAVIVSDLQS